MLTLSLGGATNSLAVGNLRSAGVSFDVKFALQTIDNNLEVKLAHTGNNGLTGFLIGVEAESRVFLSHLGETERHLFLVGLSLRLNSDRDRWLWKLDRFEVDRMSRVTERSTGDDFLKTDNGGDIASADLGNILALIGEHTDETTDALFLAGSSIHDRLTSLQHPRIDANED